MILRGEKEISSFGRVRFLKVPRFVNKNNKDEAGVNTCFTTFFARSRSPSEAFGWRRPNALEKTLKVHQHRNRALSSSIFFVVVLLIFAFLLASPLVVADLCLTPTTAEQVVSTTGSTTHLCYGHYRLSGIRLTAPRSTLHCGGATLEGDLSGSGIIITAPDVTLKDCTLITHQRAVSVLNAPGVSFEKMTLKNNVVGVHALNTKFKPHGILFEDNERNIVFEERASREKNLSTDAPLPSGLLAALNLTAEQHRAGSAGVILEKKLAVDEDRSTFSITLTITQDMDNLILYEHVPKELAATASEVVFSYPDVTIVNPDPDFMIPIGRVKVNTKFNIEYSLGKKVGDDDPLPVSVVVNLPAPAPVAPPPRAPEPTEESAGVVSDISSTNVRWWTIFFFVLALIVFFVVYKIEKLRVEQH